MMTRATPVALSYALLAVACGLSAVGDRAPPDGSVSLGPGSDASGDPSIVVVPPDDAPAGDAVDSGYDAGGSPGADGAAADAEDPSSCDASSDPLNCGSCGHDCQGGACVAGACQPFALITGEAGPTDVRVNNTYVYWVNGGNVANMDGQVRRALLDGSSRVTLVDHQASPAGLEVTSTTIYWNNWGDQTFWRSDLDGGAITTLYTGANGCMATDPSTGALYGIYWNMGSVEKLGSTQENPLVTGLNQPWGVFTDGTSLYWTTFTTIEKGTLTGGNATQWLADGQAPQCLVGDGTYLYWPDYKNGSVNRRSLAGGAVTTLATGQSSPQGIALRAGLLYWTSGSSVMRLAL
jgi:hypothetical protein